MKQFLSTCILFTMFFGYLPSINAANEDTAPDLVILNTDVIPNTISGSGTLDDSVNGGVAVINYDLFTSTNFSSGDFDRTQLRIVGDEARFEFRDLGGVGAGFIGDASASFTINFDTPLDNLFLIDGGPQDEDESLWKYSWQVSGTGSQTATVTYDNNPYIFDFEPFDSVNEGALYYGTGTSMVNEGAIINPGISLRFDEDSDAFNNSTGVWTNDYWSIMLPDNIISITVEYNVTKTNSDGLANEAVHLNWGEADIFPSNSIPTDITFSGATSIDENISVPLLLGTLDTTDTDSGDSHSYSFVSGAGDDDNTSFTLSGSELYINTSPDFEAQSTYSIRIETDDGNGGVFEKVFNFNVNDVDEIPPIISVTAPTKLDNTTITDTSFLISDANGVDIDSIRIGTGSMSTSALSCTPSSGTSTSVTCTLAIESSGDLIISASDIVGNVQTDSENNYIIDTVPPSVPSISVNTTGPYSVDNPEIVFSSNDNVGIDFYEVIYSQDDGGTGTGTLTTITPATSPVVLTLDPDETVHEVRVRVYDTAGNVSENIVRFPPIITFSSPTTLSNTGITDTTITITSPDGNDIDNIQFTTSSGTTLSSPFTCTGTGADTSSPYASPVTCTGGVISSTNNTTGTIQVNARDSINLGIGQNSQSYTIDTIAPVITLSGSSTINHEVHTPFTDEGAICTDNYDMNCIVTSTGVVDTFTLGTYTLTYSATDAAGNIETQDRTIQVVDTTAPVISLIGSGSITQIKGYSYTDSGATASDNHDTNISGNITVSGSVDTNTVGLYTLRYNISDSSGNMATEVTRDINVVPGDTPSLSLIGSSVVIHERGTIYNDSGASAIDTEDGDITHQVVSSGSIDINTLGSYTVTYDVEDISGNSAPTITRTVIVADTSTDTDGDGLPDVVEQQIGTDPTLDDTDNDGTNDDNNDLDNVSPIIELGANNNGDGNGDGALDAVQNEVSSLPNTINSAYNTLELSNSGATSCDQINFFSHVRESNLGTQDNDYNYDIGLWDFEIHCSNTGATADIQIYLDTTYDTSSWVYRKHNEATNTYTDISSIVTYTTETVGTTPVTVINYSITDGGIYDEDGVANGVIIDPSGPAVRQSGGGGTGRVKYDRCDGNDTSGSIYDGKCSKDEEQEENIENENITIDENTKEENIETPVDKEEEVIEEEIDTETEYIVENNFSSCPIIDDITNPNYLYQTSGKFVDENDSRHTDLILKFAEIGIVDGYDDGTFKPLQEMTRTEFLKVALISHCYEYRELEGMTEYNDVEKNTWQARVIEKAQSLGMINGDRDEDGNKVFRPNDIISKAEAVKILMRISMIQAQETEPTAYSDITVDWHTKYIENGEALGLFDSDKDNYNFKPDSGVKREDMIDLINRLVNLYR